jgi:hypothetical protein
MAAGDTCYIHSGTYYESIRPANSGIADHPITFTAFGGDRVVVSGCKPVSGWTRQAGNIYTTAVSEEVRELFIKGSHMLWARHPNMPYDRVRGFDMQRPALGTANPPANVDWTGVIVFRAINKEGWWNRIAKPNKYVQLSNSIVDGGWLAGVPGLIDSEREWCWKDGILYLYPPGGKNPSTLLVEAKVRDCAFDISERDYVDLKKITVFGAAINMNAANHCVMDGCKAFYVGSMFDPRTFHVKPDDNCSPLSTNLTGKGILVGGSHNVIKNCEIAHSWGNCVSIIGRNHTVFNCEIYDANWQGWECGVVAMNGGGHVIRQNSLHDAQRAALLCTYKFDLSPPAEPSLITMNDIYDTGMAKTDNGGIYCFMTDGNGTVISYNWVHDNHNGNSDTLHNGHGIYLDNYSRNFIIHHNVIWNLTHRPRAAGIDANNPEQGLAPNNHQFYNNTMWNCKRPINTPDNDWNGTRGRPYWVNTKIFNNILLKEQTFGPAAVGNNFTNENAMLVNPKMRDFRLSVSSKCINAGKVMPGITDGYVGSAPDIGACEYGGIAWKPGCNLKSSAPSRSGRR